MKIDPKIESATRSMLSHAGRAELDEVSGIIERLGDLDRFRECVELCVRITGYIAIDVSGPEWPTDAALRRLAEGAVKVEDKYDLDVGDVFNFLRKAALEFRPVDEVFPSSNEAAILPIVITSSLLLSYAPRGKDVGEYLDEIEESLVAAASVEPSVLPGMILHAHRVQANKAK